MGPDLVLAANMLELSMDKVAVVFDDAAAAVGACVQDYCDLNVVAGVGVAVAADAFVDNGHLWLDL